MTRSEHALIGGARILAGTLGVTSLDARLTWRIRSRPGDRLGPLVTGTTSDPMIDLVEVGRTLGLHRLHRSWDGSALKRLEGIGVSPHGAPWQCVLTCTMPQRPGTAAERAELVTARIPRSSTLAHERTRVLTQRAEVLAAYRARGYVVSSTRSEAEPGDPASYRIVDHLRSRDPGKVYT
jgi:hypothetical protein